MWGKLDPVRRLALELSDTWLVAFARCRVAGDYDEFHAGLYHGAPRDFSQELVSDDRGHGR